jgi:hypothetical protein
VDLGTEHDALHRTVLLVNGEKDSP